MTGFEKRPLGRTALEVTALGLGCATLGGSRVPVSREEAEAIVRAAWAAGVRYVDTHPFTGLGRRSVVSATRCVMYRVMTGCCRQKSGGCCALT
jgi:hypothetical protein